MRHDALFLVSLSLLAAPSVQAGPLRWASNNYNNHNPNLARADDNAPQDAASDGGNGDLSQPEFQTLDTPVPTIPESLRTSVLTQLSEGPASSSVFMTSSTLPSTTSKIPSDSLVLVPFPDSTTSTVSEAPTSPEGTLSSTSVPETTDPVDSTSDLQTSQIETPTEVPPITSSAGSVESTISDISSTTTTEAVAPTTDLESPSSPIESGSGPGTTSTTTSIESNTDTTSLPSEAPTTSDAGNTPTPNPTDSSVVTSSSGVPTSTGSDTSPVVAPPPTQTTSSASTSMPRGNRNSTMTTRTRQFRISTESGVRTSPVATDSGTGTPSSPPIFETSSQNRGGSPKILPTNTDTSASASASEAPTSSGLESPSFLSTTSLNAAPTTEQSTPTPPVETPTPITSSSSTSPVQESPTAPDTTTTTASTSSTSIVTVEPTGQPQLDIPTSKPMPTGTDNDDDKVSDAVFAANLEQAKRFNILFSTLDPDSACTSSQTACIQGQVASCTEGGSFERYACASGSGERCFALPMNTTEGVFVGCANVVAAENILGIQDGSGSGNDDGSGTSSTSAATEPPIPTVTLTTLVTVGGDDGPSSSSSSSTPPTPTTPAIVITTTTPSTPSPTNVISQTIGQNPDGGADFSSPTTTSKSVPTDPDRLVLIPFPDPTTTEGDSNGGNDGVFPSPTAQASGSEEAGMDNNNGGTGGGSSAAADSQITRVESGTPTVSLFFTVTVTATETETQTVVIS